MKENYNIPTLEREMIEQLDSVINSTWETRLDIDEESIELWKEQFR